MWSIEKIKNDLEKRLSSYRYHHSLQTMEVAIELAKHYHYDITIAALTALAHDVAKELSNEEQDKIQKRYPMIDFEQILPNVRHGYYGAIIAKEIYGFNKEMCTAIQYHTTGRKQMNLLDKIVFVADKIEPGKDYPGITEERRLAFINLDQACICCLENKLKKLATNDKKLSPLSLEALQCLKENQHHVIE